MKGARLISVYAAFLAMFGVVMGRLYLLAGNQDYASTARAQTVTTLELPRQRGDILDVEGRSFTGLSDQWYALALPGDDSYVTLFRYVSYEDQSLLYDQAGQSAGPFLMPVDRDLTGEGVFSVCEPVREMELPIAVHILGYLDQEGHGVTGVEAAFDDLLYQPAGDILRCSTTARGSLMEDSQPLFSEAPAASQAVQLTLDRSIQRMVEGVARDGMEKGCILVLDTATAEIRAAVSMPAYDPDNLQKSIDANDTSLINRCFSAFSVGSVFKPLLAAVALEEGIDPDESYECKGWIQVDDQIFRCAQGTAHGQVDMAEALAQSCNCYFVRLGQQLGGEKILQVARSAGFGQPVYFAASLKTAAGVLPEAQQLQSSGELANFSFGQGHFTATPVQVAALLNLFAGDGVYRQPTLVRGIVDQNTGLLEPSVYTGQPVQVFEEETVEQLRRMLWGVVGHGLGRPALPSFGGAGGKTGTAQTGRFSPEGEEYTDVWFAGFWPAEEPRYTVVVLLDSTLQPSGAAASLFSQLCTGLGYLEEPAA